MIDGWSYCPWTKSLLSHSHMPVYGNCVHIYKFGFEDRILHIEKGSVWNGIAKSFSVPYIALYCFCLGRYVIIENIKANANTWLFFRRCLWSQRFRSIGTTVYRLSFLTIYFTERLVSIKICSFWENLHVTIYNILTLKVRGPNYL